MQLLANLTFPLLYQKCKFGGDLVGGLVKGRKLLYTRTVEKYHCSSQGFI